MTPEQEARVEIDKLLEQAGWRIFDAAEANIHASRGVAIRGFPQYVAPYNNFKFNEEYIDQCLSSKTLDTTAWLCIFTTQRKTRCGATKGSLRNVKLT